MCGEHMRMQNVALATSGSSPRVRGTPRSSLAARLTRGIIPACAGNTRQRHHLVVQVRDHPRVCGEHTSMIFSLPPSSGSSPRVRGTLACLRDARQPGGIIPACAGNTAAAGAYPDVTRDHPRVCGEHVTRPCTRLTISGSSPRVRGTRLVGFGII